MLKIFLASHGHLATGMKSSLDVLLGSSKSVYAYDAYVDETNLKDAIDAFYQSISSDDQVLLLSDLYGGSVNQVMYPYLTKPNTRLIAGVNLAFLLEIAVKEELSDQELQAIVQNAGKALQQVFMKNEEVKEDKDFF